MRKRAGRIVMLVLLGACTALAQNKDVGVVAVFSPTTTEATPGSPTVAGTAGVGTLFSFAWQVKELPVGSLYIELPVTLASNASIVVNGVTTPQRFTDLFVPGVRYKLPLKKRWSLYGVAGFGFAGYGVNNAGKTFWANTSVFDVGGGVDFRVTRLLSLRSEVRDYISVRPGVGGTTGRNHTEIGILGIGLHF